MAVVALRSDRAEMEQLRAVFGQIQVKSVVLQICAVSLVFFIAQQIFQPPVAGVEALDGQRDKALAAVRRQIHNDEIKAVRL